MADYFFPTGGEPQMQAASQSGIGESGIGGGWFSNLKSGFSDFMASPEGMNAMLGLMQGIQQAQQPEVIDLGQGFIMRKKPGIGKIISGALGGATSGMMKSKLAQMAEQKEQSTWEKRLAKQHELDMQRQQAGFAQQEKMQAAQARTLAEAAARERQYESMMQDPRMNPALQDKLRREHDKWLAEQARLEDKDIAYADLQRELHTKTPEEIALLNAQAEASRAQAAAAHALAGKRKSETIQEGGGISGSADWMLPNAMGQSVKGAKPKVTIPYPVGITPSVGSPAEATPSSPKTMVDPDAEYKAWLKEEMEAARLAGKPTTIGELGVQVGEALRGLLGYAQEGFGYSPTLATRKPANLPIADKTRLEKYFGRPMTWAEYQRVRAGIEQGRLINPWNER